MGDGIDDAGAQLILDSFNGVVWIAALSFAPRHADADGTDTVLLRN